MTELKDQLSLLGRKTEYRQNYAPEVLEAFDNKHPGNDYWVRFNCPEFTSLCPITGQSLCFFLRPNRREELMLPDVSALFVFLLFQ